MTATRTKAPPRAATPRARTSTECNRFFLLADPTRLKILEALRDGHGLIAVGKLCEQLQMAQPIISHHLQKLKFAGVVTAEKRGVSVFYRIDPEVFENLAEFVLALAAP